MIVDLSVIDTAVGRSGIFSPPARVCGQRDYRQWLQEKFQRDHEFRQYMMVVSRPASGVQQIVGPYSSELKNCLSDLRNPKLSEFAK